MINFLIFTLSQTIYKKCQGWFLGICIQNLTNQKDEYIMIWLYFYSINKTMSSEDLKKIKAEVQKILDNHLDENQRFSIEDLDEEGTFLLIDLLTEKDDKRREEIWTQITDKISELQMDIDLTNNSVLEIKDKLDFHDNEIKDLSSLKEWINLDINLEQQIQNM